MLIIADENIPLVREVFGRLGEVAAVPGREMTAELVRPAGMLLVRSVTKVTRELLSGSGVRFLATATIGTDHVDEEYLRESGVAFAYAPGSNARSVAEYVTAALLVLEERGALELCGSTLGIVGVGNVGGRLARLAPALGMKVLLNDPPRAGREGPGGFVELDELLGASDAVTLHVPLTSAGPDATLHMADAGFLDDIKPGSVLINTSRGPVADGGALLEAGRKGKLAGLVLDVWEGEPEVDLSLVEAADLATPHIAGYSYDGKIAGVRMIYEAACRFLGEAPAWSADTSPREELEVPHVAGMLEAVRASCDIEADDARMRAALLSGAGESPGEAFDRLRREYPVRREFAGWSVRLECPSGALGGALGALGFKVL